MLLEDSVKEFIFECQVRQYTNATIRGYRNGLNYLVNYLKAEHQLTELEEVQTIHLKAFFVYQRERDRKETYLNGLLKTFRAFFKYHTEMENIKTNPALKVSWMKEKVPVIQTFKDAEVRRMLAVYNGNDYQEIRNNAVIAILFDTGMRCNELCSLKSDCVHDNYILIYGKGKKERQVGKSPYLSKLLMRYERAKKNYFEYKNVDTEHYFLSRTGRPLTCSAVENIVSYAGEYASVSSSVRCSPHTCRHYFAQAQLKNGTDVYSLSRLLGHSNIAITQRYLQGLKDNDVVERSIATSVLMNLK